MKKTTLPLALLLISTVTFALPAPYHFECPSPKQIVSVKIGPNSYSHVATLTSSNKNITIMFHNNSDTKKVGAFVGATLIGQTVSCIYLNKSNHQQTSLSNYGSIQGIASFRNLPSNTRGCETFAPQAHNPFALYKCTFEFDGT